MEVECPISCVRSACPDPDFLEKHSTFVLTICTLLGGGIGVVLTYFLKSRCKTIKTPCLSCDRDVIQLDSKDIEIATDRQTAPPPSSA